MSHSSSPNLGLNIQVAVRRIVAFMCTYARAHRGTLTAAYNNPNHHRAMVPCSQEGAYSKGTQSHGRYISDKMRTSFDFIGFSRYEWMSLVKSTSSNASVFIVGHHRGNHYARSILKLSNEVLADNPHYEYLAGVFVNRRLLHRYPCFVETYGLVQVPDEMIYASARYLKSYSPDRFTPPVVANAQTAPPLGDLIGDADALRAAMHAGETLGLTTQYVEGTMTMNELVQIDYNNGGQLAAFDAAVLLYQIYAPLADVYPAFTHYDLNTHNVLLVSAPPQTYYTMHYHTTVNGVESTVSFVSKYLVKIIDYARCYYDDGARGSTAIMADKLYRYDPNTCAHASTEAEPKVNGVWFVPPISPKSSSKGIQPQHPNQTIDLICAYYYLHNLKITGKLSGSFPTQEQAKALLHKLPPVLRHTPFNATSTASQKCDPGTIPDQINNVVDLAAELTRMIALRPRDDLVFEFYQGRRSIGDMHVYLGDTDRATEWIPVLK